MSEPIDEVMDLLSGKASISPNVLASVIMAEFGGPAEVAKEMYASYKQLQDPRDKLRQLNKIVDVLLKLGELRQDLGQDLDEQEVAFAQQVVDRNPEVLATIEELIPDLKGAGSG